VRVKRLMELASRADDTCMVYLKENNRPKTPPHADFPHTSEEDPTQNSPAATLVLVPLSLLLNSAKVHHRLQDCLFLSLSFLTCLFLFLCPFHPAISNNSMQRSSLLPSCYIPVQELQIICFIIIIIIFALPKNSSFTFCSLLLPSSFLL